MHDDITYRGMNILITICARGGSKGIPGKNIKPVGGKPLLAYSIETAKRFAEHYALKKGHAGHSVDIELSTDSEAIKDVAREYGLSTDYVRPAYLANDTCGKPDAIRDLLCYAGEHYDKKYDYVIDLDVTSPIRTVEDIEECLRLIEAAPEAKTIFSVNPCARNPYFNQVQEDSDGYCHVVLGGKYTTRQGSPKVYDMNASVYVYRPETLMCEHPKAVTDRSLIYVMDHVCFDLDEPSDYDYLAYLIDSGKIML